MENDIALKPSERRELIRVLADEILNYSTNPSKKLVKIVARNCVSKYIVLEDNIEDVKLGNGYESLAHQIYTRIENLRRKPYVDSGISNDDNLNEVQEKRKRKYSVLDSYGCVQWDPPFPMNDTEETLSLKKKRLLEKSNKDVPTLIIGTYYLQRKDINGGMTICNLMKEYPPLFYDIGMFCHFQILTDIDILKTLEQNVSSKQKDILSFLKSSRKKNIINFFHDSQKGANEFLNLIIGIARYFEEDESFLITPVNMIFINFCTIFILI